MTSLEINGGSNSVSVSYNYITTSSDKRLKKNIFDIDEKMINVYKSFRPVEFEFKDELTHYIKGRHYGLLAQEAVESYKENGVNCDNLELVHQREIDKESNENLVIGSDDKVWSMNYEELNALHIQFAQYLDKRISRIEKLISMEGNE